MRKHKSVQLKSKLVPEHNGGELAPHGAGDAYAVGNRRHAVGVGDGSH